jgi:hypothetical protein
LAGQSPSQSAPEPDPRNGESDDTSPIHAPTPKGESEPSSMATEKNAGRGFILAPNAPSPVRFRNPIFPKPRGIAGFSRSNSRCMREVSASADSMAERVGFEPTDPLRGHLISSQARSTELRHLSAGAEASRITSIWVFQEGGRLALLARSGADSPPSGPRASLRPPRGPGLAPSSFRRLSKRVSSGPGTRRRPRDDDDVSTLSNVGRIESIWRVTT